MQLTSCRALAPATLSKILKESTMIDPSIITFVRFRRLITRCDDSLLPTESLVLRWADRVVDPLLEVRALRLLLSEAAVDALLLLLQGTVVVALSAWVSEVADAMRGLSSARM